MTHARADGVGAALLGAAYEAAGKASTTGFAGLFAETTTQYEKRYGEGGDILGSIAAKNHRNGVLNPYTQLRRDLGEDFCEGRRAIEEGWVTRGGRLPVNLSGGLKAKGHRVGATGVSQHAVSAMQLSGTAGDMQLPGARRAGCTTWAGSPSPTTSACSKPFRRTLDRGGVDQDDH